MENGRASGSRRLLGLPRRFDSKLAAPSCLTSRRSRPDCTPSSTSSRPNYPTNSGTLRQICAGPRSHRHHGVGQRK